MILDRLPFQVPDRGTLPELREYAGVVSGGDAEGRRLYGGQPRLQTPVPALSGRAGL